jgi:hypothetical protein
VPREGVRTVGAEEETIVEETIVLLRLAHWRLLWPRSARRRSLSLGRGRMWLNDLGTQSFQGGDTVVVNGD